MPLSTAPLITTIPRFLSSRRHERWRILLVGDNDVGKTSFAYRFSDDVYEEGSGERSLFDEDRVKECRFDDKDSCTVSLMDTWVPQSSYVGIEDEIPFCHGFILLYSTTSRSSFQEISRTCRHLPLGAKRYRNLVLILVGTKSDDTSSREVTPEEGRAMADELGCQAFFETSAKSGENVDDAVLAMVLALRKETKERKLDVTSSFLMIFRLISRFRGGGSRIKEDAG